MHSRSIFVTLALLAGVALGADAKTVRGEVIDVQCQKQHADHVGEEHVDCALSCAKKGARMGILTPDGVYTITGAYTAENNRRLLEFIARQVEATGDVNEKDGVRTIDVSSMRLAATRDEP